MWYTLASAAATRRLHTQGGTCARKTRTSLPWAMVLNRVAVLVTSSQLAPMGVRSRGSMFQLFAACMEKVHPESNDTDAVNAGAQTRLVWYDEP